MDTNDNKPTVEKTDSQRLDEITAHLKSIRSSVTFFVVMTLIVILIQACAALM